MWVWAAVRREREEGRGVPEEVVERRDGTRREVVKVWRRVG